MMVYFCLSPRHHSSLLPVPLLSLCYNEERLQPELGLGVGEAGARDAPAALPFTPNPHPPWDADQGVRGQTQKMCLTFLLRVPHALDGWEQGVLPKGAWRSKQTSWGRGCTRSFLGLSPSWPTHHLELSVLI